MEHAFNEKPLKKCQTLEKLFQVVEACLFYQVPKPVFLCHEQGLLHHDNIFQIR